MQKVTIHLQTRKNLTLFDFNNQKVGTVVKDIANGQLKGDKFEGGSTKTYGIKDGGVDIVTSKLPSDIKDAVEKLKNKSRMVN